MVKHGKFFGIFLLLIIVMVISATFYLGASSTAPMIPVPSPNGYQVLVDVGKLVQGIPEDYDESQNLDSLTSCVELNIAGVNRLNEATSMEFAVPVDRQAGLDSVASQVMDDCGWIRQALRLLYVQARVAELDEEFDVAAERYAQQFKMANRSSSGGLLVNKQISIACERQALLKISELADRLSDAGKAQVLARIGTINRQFQPIDSYVQREHNLVRNQHGRIIGSWMIYMTQSSQKKSLEPLKSTDEDIESLFQDVKARLSHVEK